MLVVYRKINGLKLQEVYFNKNIPGERPNCDIRHTVQAKVSDGKMEEFFSSVLYLNDSLDHILKNIKKGFVYEIRRANDADNIRVLIMDKPDKQNILVFSKFYDHFATSKGIAKSNIKKLNTLAMSNGLVLAAAHSLGHGDKWLSVHMYICDGERARLLYSGSNIQFNTKESRQLIGRANKLLHWKMIEHFKSTGYLEYDFGGISKSEKLCQIDKFKESFGGTEVLEYNCLQGISLKGKIAIMAFRFISRLKNLKFTFSKQ